MVETVLEWENISRILEKNGEVMVETVLKWENISRIVGKTGKVWWKQCLNGKISVELLTKRKNYGGNSA